MSLLWSARTAQMLTGACQLGCLLLLVTCDQHRAGNLASSSEPKQAEPSQPMNAQPPAPAPAADPPRDPHAADPAHRQLASEDHYDRPSIDFTSVEAAMAVLAYAMQTKDTSLLLDCFAPRDSWYSINTVEKPWSRTKLTYQSLAAGVQSGGDFRDFFFGDDGDDSFRNYFVGQNLGAWHALDRLRFAPPGSSEQQPTFVQWRKRGDRYVVSEIGFPAD